jgi:hypothetical protein
MVLADTRSVLYNQELVKFREMMDERITRVDPQLNLIPQEHLPLIAKLVQERSVFLMSTEHSVPIPPPLATRL